MLPAAPDDVHLLDDLHAVVQPGPEGATVMCVIGVHSHAHCRVLQR